MNTQRYPARKATILGLTSKPIHRRMVNKLHRVDGKLIGQVRHRGEFYAVRQVDDDRELFHYVKWDAAAQQWQKATLKEEE